MQSAPNTANFSLSLITKCGFLAVSRAISFGLFGLVLNVVLLVAAWPEIRAVIDIGHAAHTSLGALVLLLRFASPAGMLVLLLMLLPIAYFILGQKHGVGRALHFAFSQNREFLLQAILGKFGELVESRSLLTTGSASEQIPALLNKHLRKMDNLPKPLAWLVRRFMREANVVPAAKAVAQRPGAERLNLAQFLSATADELGSSISADAFQPSLSWFWILLAVNLGTFALLKFYF